MVQDVIGPLITYLLSKDDVTNLLDNDPVNTSVKAVYGGRLPPAVAQAEIAINCMLLRYDGGGRPTAKTDRIQRLGVEVRSIGTNPKRAADIDYAMTNAVYNIMRGLTIHGTFFYSVGYGSPLSTIDHYDGWDTVIRELIVTASECRATNNDNL